MRHFALLNTDQTSCYNAYGDEISCAGSGQDAENRPVLEAPAERFIAEDGVVTDNLTGLQWSLNASPAVFPMSWDEAFKYLKELNTSGYQGINAWRLPTRRELYSLISHRFINPSLPEAQPFADVFSGYFWTASPCSRLMNQAWYIHLGGGRVYRGIKENSYMVWPVAGPRSGEMNPPERFETASNTVLDRLTGRRWLTSATEINRPVTWEEAIAAVDFLNTENTAGYDDWRLPNIRELESLVVLSLHSPALTKEFFSGSIAEGYWSSTTSAYETRYAWVLYPLDGAIGVGFKQLPDFCVWAVRRED